MKYINPDVESSYRDNNLGLTLYNLILDLKPKKIIEFGTLNGYSAISMAMALDELNNGGTIICYDLWDSYPYKHSTMEKTLNNINKYSLANFIELKYLNFNDWVCEDFDLLHLDISNDGDTIKNLHKKVNNNLKNGSNLIFEGGSVERDNVEWMIKYNKVPINSIQNILKYKVLNPMFPSISIIDKFSI